MIPKVFVYQGSEHCAVATNIIQGLRREFGARNVVRLAALDSGNPAYDPGEPLVAIISPDETGIEIDGALAKLLSGIAPGPDAHVFPVLLPGAKMPALERLPEALRWFHYVNAISVSGNDPAAQVRELAKFIRSQATLSEPVAPTQFLLESLWHAFKPMLLFAFVWGPLVLLLAFCISVVLALVVPWASDGSRRLGGIVFTVLWLTGALVGAIMGRGLGWRGMVAGTAIGMVVPWLPIVVSLSLHVWLVTSLGYFPSLESWVPPAGAASIVGVPSALTVSLLATGWTSSRLARSETVRHSLQISALPPIFGTVLALVTSGLANTVIFNDGLSMSALGIVLFLAVQTAAAGTMMGFARGILSVLEGRQSATPKGIWPAMSSEDYMNSTGISDNRETENKPPTRYKRKTTVSNIFLSYRRSDSARATGQVYDVLKHTMKGSHIFRDIDAIPYGLNFKEVMRDELSSCDVFVAVIGGGWLEARDEYGHRMLDKAVDFVRYELEFALERGVPIVVTLVDGAELPRAEMLPESIRALAECAAVRFSPNDDSLELVHAIKSQPDSPQRSLANRERLDAALRMAASDCTLFAALAAALGACLRTATLDRAPDFGVMLYITFLVLVPTAVGGLTGKRLGGWPFAAVFGLGLLVVSALIMMAMFISAALPQAIYRIIVRDTITNVQATELLVVGFTIFVGGGGGALVAVRHVVRKRLLRIRIWYRTLWVTGGAVVGGAIGTPVGIALVTAFPQENWPRTYEVLGAVVTLATSAGVSGLFHGAVRGWTRRHR